MVGSHPSQGTRRTLTDIDVDLARAAYRRMRHGDNDISLRGNMNTIDALLDERLQLVGRRSK